MITLKDHSSVSNNDAIINNQLGNEKTPYAQQSHAVGNILAQAGRIPGGIAQGIIKAISAPGLLKEGLDRKYQGSGQSPTLKVKNEAVNRFNENRAITYAASKANKDVENWTDKWVAAPESKAASVAAFAFDTIGEAIPTIAATIAGGATTAPSILVGNAPGYAAGTAKAISSEMLEGSGDPIRALIRGATAYASEAIGGKLFGGMQAAKGASGWVADAVGEGLEENIDSVLFSAVTGDAYTAADAVQDFAIGTLAGAVLGGAGKAIHVHSDVAQRQAHAPKAGEVSEFIAPKPAPSDGRKTVDFTPKSARGTDGPAAPVDMISKPNVMPSHITTEMSMESAPTMRTGGATSQSLELGYARSDGNAVPSTPDTEPWKFPDPEPNTAPFPDMPDADPDSTPAVDPQIIPFPSPAQPEPNTVPFSTPMQPDTDTPATNPEIIPFPSTLDPDVIPDVDPDASPNIVQFPQPEINPDIHSEPDVSPDINTEPDVSPQTSPVTTPQTFPLVRPRTEPEVKPQDEPVAEPVPQSEPGVAPNAEPKTVPQEVPAVSPTADPSTQTQPMPKTVPSAQPNHTPRIQAQPVPNEQPEMAQDLQALAKSIWMPESVARQSHMAQQNPDTDTSSRKRRDSERGSSDFNVTRGAGSIGRVYETAGYHTTFGGLSSY